MNKGYILLYRSTFDNDILDEPDVPYNKRLAWIDLLMLVNFEPKQCQASNGDVFEVRRGQTLTSLQHLADRWHWSKRKVQKFLDLLERSGMIYKDPIRFGRGATLVTILKYEQYQNRLEASDSNGGTQRVTQNQDFGTKEVTQRVTHEVTQNPLEFQGASTPEGTLQVTQRVTQRVREGVRKGLPTKTSNQYINNKTKKGGSDFWR